MSQSINLNSEVGVTCHFESAAFWLAIPLERDYSCLSRSASGAEPEPRQRGVMSGCTLLYFSDSSAAAPKARHADRIRLGKLGIGATKRGRRFGGNDALPRYKGLPSCLEID